MEIEYLIKLKETPKIGNWKNEGIPEIKIKELENNLKIKLPFAFKEYLFLAGEFDNFLTGWNRGFENLEFMQEEAKKTFQKEGLILKPFWCFAEYNHAESSLFFFLDEGDNPPVYSFIADKGLLDEKGNEVSYLKFRNSFSEYIDKCIEAAS